MEIASALGSIVPILFVTEMAYFWIKGEFLWVKFKVPIQIQLANMLIAIVLPIAITFYLIDHLQPFALLETSLTWYWFIYGYIVWEFSHFVYHYLGHKVRILWCLHSPHHAPAHMNLSVTFVHFYLEGPYADFVRISICILMGLDPYLLLPIRGIDAFWGGFIHIGEESIANGKMGFLHKIILTPAHHRVHHAKNPIYIDTNFCNLLNIWDRLFKTYQEIEDDTPPSYGIKRAVNTNSFWDVYVGESLFH